MYAPKPPGRLDCPPESSCTHHPTHRADRAREEGRRSDRSGHHRAQRADLARGVL